MNVMEFIFCILTLFCHIAKQRLLKFKKKILQARIMFKLTG